jgi:hypothetical protein
MSDRLALAVGGIVVVLMMATGYLSAQQGERPWQTSWAAFVSLLGPEPGPSSIPAYRQFEGEAVSWEGVVGAFATETTFPVDMTPNAATGYEVILQVTPTTGELVRWQALAVGTRIRFKGEIASLFPMKVTSVTPAGATSTRSVAAVFVKGGEFVNR